MNENPEQKAYPKATIFIFVLFAVAVYLHGLDVPLLGPDEPRYSQVAREMFERGDWVTPTLGGFDWFEKPALLYWLQIASYKFFGVNEFAARFGSALFGLGTIVSLWVLGRFWARGNGSARLLPSSTLLVSASSLGLLVFSRGASFDIVITFPLTAALVAYFIYDRLENKSGLRGNLTLVIFYLFCGVSLIAKGLIGAVFPLAIISSYHLLSRRMPSRHTLVSLIWGTVVMLLAASSWYLPMYLQNGWKFIDEFIVQHHFQRFTSNKYLHPQPIWFFWVIFPLMILPWMPFFLAGVWKSVSNVISKVRGGESSPASPLRMFAAAWMLVPLVFFSFSGSKLPGYILPAVPAALIFTADFVSTLAGRSARWRQTLPTLAFATLAVVSLLVAIPLRSWARHETVRDLIDASRAAGFQTEPVVNLHTVSHSLEFYASGRLVRNDSLELIGIKPADDELQRQRRFEGLSELADYLRATGSAPVLVVVPVEYKGQLEEGKALDSKYIADNGELAIYSAKLKE